MVAGVVPKPTAMASVKLVPVILTVVPPDVSPATGLTAVIVGAVSYVNWSAAEVALVPTGVVTVTSTLPAAPPGAVTVIDVAEAAVMVPAVVPKLTAVAPVNAVPVRVTVVPPDSGPATGLTPVTLGAAS